jgi:twinkle protein
VEVTMKKLEESPIVLKHQPCDECGSSDAKSYREDGSAFCFSCNKNFKPTNINIEETKVNNFESNTTVGLSEVATYNSYQLSSRGISKETVDHYNVKMSVDVDGRPEAHYYPFTSNGQIVAYKVRKLPKQFSTVGDFKNLELFGQSKCNSGKILVITEGELDAMAINEAYFQKYRRYYSVVSLPNGANSVKAIVNNLEFVRSFKEVVIAFDMDEPGQTAASEAAKMVGIGKAKIAKFQEKDACDELREHGVDAVVNALWSAKPWSPAGIMSGEAIWEKFIERKNVESIPYPKCLGGLNEKLDGIRQGEITLFTSGTGSGKSTVIKEIILDLLENTNEKIGLISLEESVGDTAEKLIGMALHKPVGGGNSISEDELRHGYEKVFGDERLILLDHQGSVSDESLISKMEYMALMGCKYLVLDHITIAVSEGAEGLSGNEAVDKVMSDLLKLVKQHNVWLGLISHLRKSQGKSFEEGQLPSIDDIKGSGSIKQISFDIIAFARNLVADEDYKRNTIKLRVLKSRFTGRTGDAGTAVYDVKTTRLSQGAQGFDLFDAA